MDSPMAGLFLDIPGNPTSIVANISAKRTSPVTGVGLVAPDSDTIERGGFMADFYINVFLDDEKAQKLADVGLSGKVVEIDGRKAIQAPMTQKEHKKLTKGFPDLSFDASNACVLPEGPEKTLFDMVVSLKSVDVMKVAITKLYNPLAGKDLRTKIT
jgi:hypothetical protein